MKAVWLTDLHLNFVSRNGVSALLKSIAYMQPDCLLVGGDTGEGNSFAGYLSEIAQAVNVPTYFVLGNHDFYQSSLVGTRRLADAISNEVKNLTWLTKAGVCRLDSNVALIGHDSWADGRLGNFFESDVLLNDFLLIKELSNLSKEAAFSELNRLGDEAASYLKRVLIEALTDHSEIILLTHVPPFRESCLYEGKVSSDEYLPFFACRAVGEMIFDIMSSQPDKRLFVLCGHTHAFSDVQPLPNLRVITGGAEYERPVVQQSIEIAAGGVTIKPPVDAPKKSFWSRWG